MIKEVFNLSATDDVRNALSESNFRVGVRNATDDSIEMLIHGVIGDGYVGLDSNSVSGFLAQNKGKKVNVNINSPGGLAFDGIAIYNAFAQHDAEVTMEVSGLCASAATIIFMSADNRKIVENATFMVHRAMGVAVGNRAVMAEVGAFLDQIDNQIAATYAARTGRKAETMMKFMVGEDDGTTFNGAQAVEEKFADAMIPLKKKKKYSADNLTEEFTADAAAKFRMIVDARLRAMNL